MFWLTGIARSHVVSQGPRWRLCSLSVCDFQGGWGPSLTARKGKGHRKYEGESILWARLTSLSHVSAPNFKEAGNYNLFKGLIVTMNKIGLWYRNKIETRISCLC